MGGRGGQGVELACYLATVRALMCASWHPAQRFSRSSKSVIVRMLVI